MKKIAVFVAAAALALASPVMNPDGIQVDPNDPRIGALVVVTPDTVWRIYGNDNPHLMPSGLYGDGDYNDLWAEISFNSTGGGTASWLGSNSGMTNSWIIRGGTVSAANPQTSWLSLPTGQVLDVVLRTQFGAEYAIGHVNIMAENMTNTPEPSTLVLFTMAAILTVISLVSRRRNT